MPEGRQERDTTPVPTTHMMPPDTIEVRTPASVATAPAFERVGERAADERHGIWNGSATNVIIEPKNEISWPRNSSRNSRPRRGVRSSRRPRTAA